MIRTDPAKAGHALIHNVPCIDGEDEEREKAMVVAGDLARIAVCVTDKPYNPQKPTAEEPPPNV